MRKIILILSAVLFMSFSWSGLTSLQGVSFTNIQGAGLTLKSGKSAVTSNQLMKKRDVDSLYAVDASYYSFAAKSANQIVVKQDIHAAATLYSSPLVASVTNAWTTCALASAGSGAHVVTLYSDDPSGIVLGAHLYGNNTGTTGSGLVDLQWYAIYSSSYLFQVGIASGETTVIYKSTTCPSAGTNVAISEGTGAITGTNQVDVYAYASIPTNCDVVVTVYTVGDNGGTASTNITILSGQTSGMVNIHLGSGTLSTITSDYVTAVSPVSYSGYNYNF